MRGCTARGAARLSAATLVNGALACLPPAVAQVLPDAGRIQEQLRVPEPPRKPTAPEIRIQPPAGDAKAQTPPFYVASFRVRGASAFPEAELAGLLGEPKREMTLAEVQALAERITTYYRDRGYIVARAIIPPQDVRDGIVQVRVVEGRYERIDVSNASEISESRIRGTISGVREDAVVHGPTLERSVLLLSDLAGIQPKATLEPGAQPGYTNLMVEVAPTKTFDYDVSLDNGGNSSTGRYRVAAGLIWNSPLDIGDRAGVRMITSGEGLFSARLNYEAPLGTSGLRGNAYVVETRYKLLEQFEPLNAKGSSHTYGASLGYPVIRSTDLNLRVQLGGEGRELEDRIGALQVVNKKSLGILQWGASGDFRDALLGGGITAFQGLVSNGRLDLRSAELVTTDASTTKAAGDYSKLWFGAQRIQRVTQQVRLALNYSAQIASKNLDSSEKYSVGGPTAVRAYPAGEAAGDDVQLVQVELRYSVTGVEGQLTPLAFADYARSRINKETWQGFVGNNVRELSGYGFGLEWTLTGRFFARGWYAHKLGDEPATADTDAGHRLWLQAGVLW